MLGFFPTIISDWVVEPTSAGFVWNSQYHGFRESLATAIPTLTRWSDSWSRTKIDANNESGEFSSLGRRWLDEIDSVAGGAWLTMSGRGWRDECRTTWQLTPWRIVSVSSTIFHVFYASAFLILHNSPNCQALIHRNIFLSISAIMQRAPSVIRLILSNFSNSVAQWSGRNFLLCSRNYFFVSFITSKESPARRCRDGKYLQTMNHCGGHNVANFNWDELSLRDRNSWDSSTSRRRGFTVTHGKKNDL